MNGNAARENPAAAGRIIRTGRDMLAVAPPFENERVYVNGLRVVVVQAVGPGDIVRVAGAAGVTSFRVERPGPELRDGRGLVCRFTGCPIVREAVVCPCGAAYTPHVVAEIGRCPVCGESLTPGDGAPVAEELL